MVGAFTEWLRKKLDRSFLVGTLLVLIVIATYSWHLGHLRLSSAEISYTSQTTKISNIVDKPLYAPHQLLELLAHQFKLNSPFWFRFVSVIMAAILLACFYLIVRAQFGNLTALASTLILASTPWFVISARSASPIIELLSPLILIAAYLSLIKNQAIKFWGFLIFILSIAVCLYAPGGIWFLLIGSILAYKSLRQLLSNLNWTLLSFSIVLLALLCVPLGRSLLKSPQLLRELSLIPSVVSSFLGILRTIGWSFLGLVWHFHEHNHLTLNRLPLLDATQIVLGFIGSVSLVLLDKAKAYMLLGFLVLAVVFSGFNNRSDLLTLSLPSIGLLIAAGLYFLREEWHSIFPKNPFARAFAATMISLLIITHVIYGLHYGLFAWPAAATADPSYVIK